MLEETLRLLVIEARAYDDISDALLEGAQDAIAATGAEHDLLTVGGVLEIPAVIALAEEGGHRPAGVRYDGYIALGCVIRDESYQFEIVAHESARGLMDLAIGKRLAIGNGLLAVEDKEQALERARVSGADRGGGAARACLQMIDHRRHLLGQAR